MMQHKFEDISRHVSLKGLLKLDQIARNAAQVARERESASSAEARANGDSSWIIAQVAFGRETVVEKDMIDAGIEACVPMRMGPERKRRYKIIPATSTPVFNGLVFVFCRNIGDALRGVQSFEHVNKVLMNGERAATFSAEAVNDFRDMASRGEYDWGRNTGKIDRGDRVRIVRGPFVGYEVPVNGFEGSDKGEAVVTINIFGKPTVFNMPLDMLEKV
ncbi:transcription termination/antitermination protein NusG [Agrobacterium rosae]|uniref:transcription termination/antitermination protein NusG n=1 Tax=Agrobacterium rosae TaxID=1972867 RepID=UPI003B9F6EE2